MAKTCCHKPLICSTQFCEFTIVVYDMKIYVYTYELLCVCDLVFVVHHVLTSVM